MPLGQKRESDFTAKSSLFSTSIFGLAQNNIKAALQVTPASAERTLRAEIDRPRVTHGAFPCRIDPLLGAVLCSEKCRIHS